MQSQSQSPQFRLDLSPALGGTIQTATHLHFPEPPKRSRQEDIRMIAAGNNKSMEDTMFSISGRLARLMFWTQGLIVFVLLLMVAGLLYWSYRLNSNLNWYYDAAYPYIEEVRDRGMSMVRHADNSSAALETVMAGAEVLTTQSIPSLMASVNRTSAMVERLEHMARNPTIKLSMA